MPAIIGFAGRFDSRQLIAALDEMITTAPDRQYGGWGLAYCYGTLLETTRFGRRPPGENADTRDAEYPDPVESLRQLIDIKTDMAIARLTDRSEMPSHSRDLQPFLRQETPRPQAFCAPGRLVHPDRLEAGRRITDSRNPTERFFLHVLGALKSSDPLASITAMHENLVEEPDQRFMLLNTKLMVVSTWQETTTDQPAAWLGTSALLRVIAPTMLESLEDLDWEPLPARTVLVLNRRRYEIGSSDKSSS